MKALRNLTLSALVVAAASTAGATETPITTNPGGSPEPTLLGTAVVSGGNLVEGILDHLYGLGNLERIGDGSDQLWYNLGTAAVSAEAKYSSYALDFGYLVGSTGSTFNNLFSVTGSGLITGVSATFTVGDSGSPFRFALNPNGGSLPPLWSSQQSDNAYDGATDHMVTWKIIAGANAGNYVIAWEDLAYGGDRDFQDLVVEVGGVQNVPEPAGVGILGAGMLAFALRRRQTR